ncbi:amino acid transporter [Natronococcus pandeyae]|uniref:Amino acid transporter n=1 Tax=Natronococcus pandeyae TaxID=2055836 RepID=A0A8J8Q6I5_9EURY|nr:APC family permease [Natronococcus pandeyae]TYL38160.1 amino acid transporter [Natronococcus pandeyae]
MPAEDFKLINEEIGPIAAVALLIGTAVGMSIFIVPTQMAAIAGPSVTVAILISIVPMVLGVLLLLQLGGAIPVAGGIYVYGSRLVGPYWGMLSMVVPVVAVWSYILFAALGFAQYLPVVTGALSLGVSVPALLAAWFLIGLFCVLNYVGVKIAANVQIAMVAFLVAGMLAFIAGSVPHFDTGNFEPMFPAGDGEPFADGLAPFFLAVVTLYIPFQGFAMIIEIGEELRDPVRNIPRVLAVGMSLVAVLTIGVIVALIGAASWQGVIDPATGEAMDGGLAAVGASFLPTWLVAFIGIAALIAAATTINTLLTSYSRTIMRASRDQVIPDVFAAVHGRFDTPHRAVLLLAVPPLLVAPFTGVLESVVLVDDVLDWLVTLTVTGIFISFMIGGVALWNLPKEFPQRYEYSIYKLPMPVLKVVAVGNVVVSFAFTLLVATSAPTALAFMIGWIVLTSLAYVYRIRAYDRQGVDLREQMSLLHKHETIGGGESGADD